MKEQHHKVIIIGAGPAGCTASIQLKRAGIDFVLFEKDRVGGLIWNANLVENCPALGGPLSGVEVAKRFAGELRRFKIKVRKEEVLLAKKAGSRFIVKTHTASYSSEHLIVASGTLPNEFKLDGKVVSSDLLPYLRTKNKGFVIIGGGDAAFDYALNLAGRNNRVSIVFRGEKASALTLLQDRVKKNKLIKVHPSLSGGFFPPLLHGGHGGSKLSQNDKLCGDDRTIVIAAIGRKPSLDFLDKSLLREPGQRLYMVGDVIRGKNRQLAIAVGDGMTAAQEIIGSVIASETKQSPDLTRGIATPLQGSRHYYTAGTAQ